MARNPIDFYANEITRLPPFFLSFRIVSYRNVRFPIVRGKSKTLIFIYRSELSAASNKSGKSLVGVKTRRATFS